MKMNDNQEQFNFSEQLAACPGGTTSEINPAFNRHPLEPAPPSKEKAQSGEEMTIKFFRFHSANPHVYEAFVEISKQMHRIGFEKFSIMGVVERYRWTWHEKKERPGKFLYCNNHNPYYARLLACALPKLRNWFSFCHCKADNQIFYDYLKRVTGVIEPVAIFKTERRNDESKTKHCNE